MDLRQLETFVQVATLGSFSRAASALDVAQPALSRQVRALETELRETLLLRNGRGVTLTEAGRRLLVHSQDILRQVALARSDLGRIRDEPAGRVVVGLPPSLAQQLTRPLIDAFHRKMPQASLAIVEGFSVHLKEWLSSGRVDVGLVYNPEADEGIDIRPVLEEPLCLISPKGSPQGRAIDLAEVAKLPLVMPQRGHIFRTLMERHAALAGLQLTVAWEVSSVPTILDLVTAGYGHATLTASAMRAATRRKALGMAPIQRPTITSTLCLVTSAKKRLTPLLHHTTHLLDGLAREL